MSCVLVFAKIALPGRSRFNQMLLPEPLDLKCYLENRIGRIKLRKKFGV